MSDLPDHEDYDRYTVLDHLAEATLLMQGPVTGLHDFYTARADNMRTAQAHLAYASVLLAATSNWGRGTAARMLTTAEQLRDLTEEN